MASAIVSETDPWEIEMWVWCIGWGGSVHCARYASALPIGFWLAFWCAFIGNTNRTRTVFTFCFVLESCKHLAGKIERLYGCLVQQNTLQALQGLAINKIPNIPQCTLPSIPPRLPDPPFQFSRVWLQDYICYSHNKSHDHWDLLMYCRLHLHSTCT